MLDYTFTAELWQYPGYASWYFITLPKNVATEIHAALSTGLYSRGFGSIKVEAQVQEVLWRTSIFPDKKSGSYLLPIKAAVRTATNITAGDRVKIKITALHEY